MGVLRLQAITKRQIVGLVGAVLLLLWIAFFAYDFVWRSKIKPEFVKTGSFVQTIVASGHVESPFRISISAQITGTVVTDRHNGASNDRHIGSTFSCGLGPFERGFKSCILPLY